jgi:hypothetical protein
VTTWLDVSDCAHEPNARGTACQHCGIPAELVTPDELAEALSAEMDAARLRADGQTSWLEPCAECGHDIHSEPCDQCDDLAQLGAYGPCQYAAPNAPLSGGAEGWA